MEQALLSNTLCDALAGAETAALRDILDEAHPADLARCLAEREPAAVWKILSLQPAEGRAEVFGYFAADLQVELARLLGRTQLAQIMFHMSADERADLFNRLSPEQRDALLPGLAQAERDDLLRLSAYPEGTAGAVMTSDYATLPHKLPPARPSRCCGARRQTRRPSIKPTSSTTSGGCSVPSRCAT
jgi:magnesium transporter